MKVVIDEAFAEKSSGGLGPSSMAQVGPHVREGRYDLVKSSTNELILPGLWNMTIKPGDRIVMSMREYPIMTALFLFPQMPAILRPNSNMKIMTLSFHHS